MKSENDAGTKPRVLIICNYFLPGYKAGGGLRTVVHTVERFSDKFDFRVINFNHDGDDIPYTSVETSQWNDVGGAQVFYLAKNEIKLSKLRQLISEINPHLIYVNSVFSILSIFLLVLRRLKLIAETPIILAPEGELSDGALQLKAAKKKFFIKFAKRFNLYKNLTWKVTAEPERIETERFKGSGGEIFIAPNMPSRSIFEEYEQQSKPSKSVGSAKMIFLSRYARKKNFKWIVDNLRQVIGELEIDVYGPLEDTEYWDETRRSIAFLPPNVTVNYKGQVTHEEVLPLMFNYHFFILPTLGENFGHVFIEALAAGCPLLISDRTPWIELATREIGWDLPLENAGGWIDKINHCISLNDPDYSKLSNNARQFACNWLSDPKIEESTLTVLRHGLDRALSNKV